MLRCKAPMKSITGMRLKMTKAVFMGFYKTRLRSLHLFYSLVLIEIVVIKRLWVD